MSCSSRSVAINESGEAGIYYDERGPPMLGSALEIAIKPFPINGEDESHPGGAVNPSTGPSFRHKRRPHNTRCLRCHSKTRSEREGRVAA
jgi:hypothetical protein